MWQDPILQCIIKKNCPGCSSLICIERSKTKCHICREYEDSVYCFDCDFKSEICSKCLILKFSKKKINSQIEPNDRKWSCFYILSTVIVTLAAISIFLHLRNSSKLKDNLNKSLIETLRQKFPAQRNETWYHILSVLEQKVPTVKSITLLYKNDKRTSDCLVKELVNIFDGSVKIGDVSFVLVRTRYKDYGEVLEQYHKVVERFRVLVTDLNVVPAKIARIFHSLCDEVSSDLKPSLFIFTLRCDEKIGNLKPLEKATAVLKEAWRELPDSDVFPLLSRVIKNVVDVVPEKQGC